MLQARRETYGDYSLLSAGRCPLCQITRRSADWRVFSRRQMQVEDQSSKRNNSKRPVWADQRRSRDLPISQPLRPVARRSKLMKKLTFAPTIDHAYPRAQGSRPECDLRILPPRALYCGWKPMSGSRPCFHLSNNKSNFQRFLVQLFGTHTCYLDHCRPPRDIGLDESCKLFRRTSRRLEPERVHPFLNVGQLQ